MYVIGPYRRNRAVGNSWTVNGQEMADASDGSGSEMGIEADGGREDDWRLAGKENKRKRKKGRQQRDRISSVETDSEGSGTPIEKESEEYKIIIKLSQDGASFGEWNPIMLTKAIHKAVGEVKNAKVLRNGSLLIFCRSSMQQGKAIRVDKIEGKKVQCSIPEDRKKSTRGVISWIPTGVSTDQIKENVVGAKVLEARRLKANRNGEKCDSLSVMLLLMSPGCRAKCI